ncbi:MAG: hypothetical protein QW769_09915 [Nitrososphaerales archaeon]
MVLPRQIIKLSTVALIVILLAPPIQFTSAKDVDERKYRFEVYWMPETIEVEKEITFYFTIRNATTGELARFLDYQVDVEDDKGNPRMFASGHSIDGKPNIEYIFESPGKYVIRIHAEDQQKEFEVFAVGISIQTNRRALNNCFSVC